MGGYIWNRIQGIAKRKISPKPNYVHESAIVAAVWAQISLFYPAGRERFRNKISRYLENNSEKGSSLLLPPSHRYFIIELASVFYGFTVQRGLRYDINRPNKCKLQRNYPV